MHGHGVHQVLLIRVTRTAFLGILPLGESRGGLALWSTCRAAQSLVWEGLDLWNARTQGRSRGGGGDWGDASLQVRVECLSFDCFLLLTVECLSSNGCFLFRVKVECLFGNSLFVAPPPPPVLWWALGG